MQELDYSLFQNFQFEKDSIVYREALCFAEEIKHSSVDLEITYKITNLSQESFQKASSSQLG